jgi:CDP-paratose 2-epimerase
LARVRLLVTGGAGFVGANVAVALAGRHPDWQVVALDNLRRRGSELNLARLRQAGVEFVHGDVRDLADLEGAGEISALVECSAEPSVLAGLDGGLDYLVRTNLVGAFNCLELARRCGAHLVFLSTSRVYPVRALTEIVLDQAETRFEPAEAQLLNGVSARGISESFPLEGARTPYGATKLAAELLIAEYADSFGLSAVIDRCGVIAGPWQMGKVDQGIFTYWLLAHWFRRPLEYIGFGGTGMQVRDLLHVDDLVELVEDQLARPEHWRGVTVNVGGGRATSLSLRETTELCRELTGRTVEIGAALADRPGDIPYYVSDCTKLFGLTDWRPACDPRRIIEDILEWVKAHERTVAEALSL